MNTIKCGFIKPFICEDGHTAQYWQIADFNHSYIKEAETNFNRAKGWKQVYILYNDIESLITNKMPVPNVREVVYIPFWSARINEDNWGNKVLERTKAISEFFSDAEIFSVGIDETMDEDFEFEKLGIKYLMKPDGTVIPKT